LWQESLSASELTVNVNEPVSLTATTLKQGSDYSDSWTGAEKIKVTGNEKTPTTKITGFEM